MNKTTRVTSVAAVALLTTANLSGALNHGKPIDQVVECGREVIKVFEGQVGPGGIPFGADAETIPFMTVAQGLDPLEAYHNAIKMADEDCDPVFQDVDWLECSMEPCEIPLICFEYQACDVYDTEYDLEFDPVSQTWKCWLVGLNETTGGCSECGTKKQGSQ